MIGLDTNILLRWLMDSEEAGIGSSKTEIELVSKLLLSERTKFFVNPIVIAETTWILEQKLKLKRHDVCEVIDRLLYAVNIVLGEPEAVKEARSVYEESGSGFADCLLGRMNMRTGCSHTLTFDKKASRSIGFRNLRTAGA
jgi:predicted nucleic-acid-binding protein